MPLDNITGHAAIHVREAVLPDTASITEIYNHAVRHTTAIWNDTVVDVANREAWLAARQRDGHPVLVAVDARGAVLGYASYGPWRAFEGYRHTMEHSVYVRADRQRGGIGRLLLVELIDRARTAGNHVMVAAIEQGNAGSIRLHEQVGFHQVGQLAQVGMKFGRWLDLVLMQLQLDERPTPPADR